MKAKKLKPFISIISIVFSFIFISLNVATSDVQAASVEDIQQKGQIVMGTSPDYPPYEFLANVNGKQKVVGMDVEIGRQIAKDLGVKFVVKQMDFDSLLVGLETGKIDFAISGLNPTPERLKSADFSKTYYKAGQYILINKTDKKLYKDYRSFNNKIVGSQTGSLQQELAKKQMKNSKTYSISKITDLIIALKSNKVSGVVVESAVAEAYAAHDDQLAYIDAKFKLTDDMSGTAIAFPKNSPTLVAEANKTIDKILKNDSEAKYIKDAGKYLAPTNKENPWMTVAKYWKYFVKGLEYTLFITIISVLFGIVLGVLFALARLGKNKVIKSIVTAFVEFIRGTPLMIQLMFVYFGLGAFLKVDISPLVAGIISVSINSSAYVSEIIRGGINSVDNGQLEAAQSLGLSYKDTMKSVIMPQAIKNIWPALGNEFISLIKETSIVSIIGVTDLIFQLRAVQSATYQGVIPIFIAMMIYFVITYSLSKLLNFYEGKMNHA